jgi:hypothetical protein
VSKRESTAPEFVGVPTTESTSASSAGRRREGEEDMPMLLQLQWADLINDGRSRTTREKHQAAATHADDHSSSGGSRVIPDRVRRLTAAMFEAFQIL